MEHVLKEEGSQKKGERLQVYYRTSLMNPKMNSLQNVLILSSSTFKEKDSRQSTI